MFKKMVFEQLFRVQWIQRKEHAFMLGFTYAIIGLISARLIFPANVGLMSVAFTSLLLIPSLNQLLALEVNMEKKENGFSLRRLFADHKDIFKVYNLLFLGIFSVFTIKSLIMPEYGIEKLFNAQLRSAGLSGSAILRFAIYNDPLVGLIPNNLLVFVVCFILILIYGAGSILFLTWNASVWGIAFGYFVRLTSEIGQGNLIIDFLNSIVPFLPHMTTEALAYISAAIVGGIVSKAVIREKFLSKRFHQIIGDALIFLLIGQVLVLIAGFIEVKLFLGQ